MGQGWRHLDHHACLVRAQVWLRLDRGEQAADALRQSHREAEAEGYRVVVAFAQSMLVGHCFAVGEWDDAIAEFDSLAQLCAELDERPALLQVAAGARALVAIHRGEPDAAQAALSVSAGMEVPHLSTLASVARALLFEATGAPEGRAEQPDRGMGRLHSPGCDGQLHRRRPRPGPPGRGRRRARPGGRRLRPGRRAVAANPPVATLQGSALRCRGLLGDDAGLLVEAATLLGAGPRPLEHGLACEDAADALARAGDLDGARHWLHEALRTYDRLDAVWDASRAMSRLRSAGVRRGSRAARARPKDGWAALTPGERAVAELVAEGLSNPEVAERLFLSRNTVKTHLAKAMRKLGLRSRFELARAEFRQSR